MNRNRLLFSAKGNITRSQFVMSGFILFAIKYNADRLLALHFNIDWFFYNYYFSPLHISIQYLNEISIRFYLLLALLSIPFILMGVFLCLKRLHDAGLKQYLVFLFFIPLINIFFFGMLAVLPSKKTLETVEEKPHLLGEVIPKSKIGGALFACGISVLLALVFTLVSVDIMQEYGWGLFIAVPFFIGFSSVLIYAYHHHPVSFGASVSIGISGVAFFGLLLMALAMEGLICILMAFPIAIVISFIGSLVAYSIQSIELKNAFRLYSLNVLFITATFITENSVNTVPEIYELKTSVVIQSPPDKVWKNLVAFNEMAPPTELLFKAGIAYPQNAKIFGHGKGAIRHCNFTTGSFIEPITTWDEPRLLQFDVWQQPVPLTELSFYKHVNAPHLENFFSSVKGQFLLTETKDHQTLLSGTTWYKNKMWPAPYWKLWSDAILHKIHLRVLNHIKKTTEE